MPQTIALTTYTPLHGEPFTVEVNSAAFSRVLSRYRTLYPLDDRDFDQMSSDIQHALIRVAREGNQ